MERSIFVATPESGGRLNVILDGRPVELTEAARAEILAILQTVTAAGVQVDHGTAAGPAAGPMRQCVAPASR